MNQAVGVLIIGVGVILLALWALMTWLTRASYRLNKLEAPRRRLLWLSAGLQVLLGFGGVLIMREIKNDPALDLPVGFGLALLSGLFFFKWLFGSGWRQTLRAWGVAAAMELVVVPIGAVLLAGGLMLLTYALYPPQY